MEPNFDTARGRLAALDELRGLAILAVVASHVGLVFGPELPAAQILAVPALGVGVDLFFVISGLVVAENVRRLQQEGQGVFWRGAGILGPANFTDRPADLGRRRDDRRFPEGRNWSRRDRRRLEGCCRFLRQFPLGSVF